MRLERKSYWHLEKEGRSAVITNKYKRTSDTKVRKTH